MRGIQLAYFFHHVFGTPVYNVNTYIGVQKVHRFVSRGLAFLHWRLLSAFGKKIAGKFPEAVPEKLPGIVPRKKNDGIAYLVYYQFLSCDLIFFWNSYCLAVPALEHFYCFHGLLLLLISIYSCIYRVKGSRYRCIDRND